MSGGVTGEERRLSPLCRCQSIFSSSSMSIEHFSQCLALSKYGEEQLSFHSNAPTTGALGGPGFSGKLHELLWLRCIPMREMH
jgi:hypothetical protein